MNNALQELCKILWENQIKVIGVQINLKLDIEAGCEWNPQLTAFFCAAAFMCWSFQLTELETQEVKSGKSILSVFEHFLLLYFYSFIFLPGW